MTTWLERHLEIRPSGGDVEAFADGLRALAILGVVIVHTWGLGGRPQVSLLGVDLTWIVGALGWGVVGFFVLSGYLLARPWFATELSGAARPSTRRFWARRYRRLAPAYYVAILLIVPLALFFGDMSPDAVRGSVGAWNLGSHITFTQLFVPVGGSEFNGIMAPVWSLTPEVTFYLLLPFVVVLFTGRRWMVTLAVTLALQFIWVRLIEHAVIAPGDATLRFVMRQQLVAYMFAFALGVSVARLVMLSRTARGSDDGPPWWMDPQCALAGFALGAAGLVFCVYESGVAELHDPTRYDLASLPAAPAMALMLYGLRFGPPALRRPFEVVGLRFVGWISYSLFLWHVAVIKLLLNHTALGRMSPGKLFPALTVATLVISIAIATVSFAYVERPFLVRGRAVPPGRRALRPSRIALAAALAGFVILWSAPGLFARGSQRPPFGSPPNAYIESRLTRDFTPLQAIDHHVISPVEFKLLSRCAARHGHTEVASTPEWGMSGSVFTCANVADAERIVGYRISVERAAGLQLVSLGRPGVHAFQAADPAPGPGLHVQMEVMYASRRNVIGIVIHATTPGEARSAARELLATVSKANPLAE